MKEETKFVELTEADLPGCGQIYFAAFQKPDETKPFYNTDRYFGRYITDPDKYAYGIRYKDRLVGILTAMQQPAFYSAYTIYVDVVAILPEYQRKGFGTMLMQSFFESVAGDTTVTLNTYKNDTPYQFYKKLHFMDDGIVNLQHFPDVYTDMIEKLTQENAELRKMWESLTKENAELESALSSAKK